MAMPEEQKPTMANTENHYDVTSAQLPLSCPLPEMPLWSSHPKVFIPLDQNGEGMCPYCGATFKLVD